MNYHESAVNHASNNSKKQQRSEHVFYEPIIIVAMAETVWGWYPKLTPMKTHVPTDVQKHLDSKIYCVALNRIIRLRECDAIPASQRTSR